MQYFGFDRPSFLSEFFGFFESNPKLTANFTTGEYKASGEAKTFTEVFDFNRAGKAWLVKDTGLVEYAVDVPRFDDGLLIEKAATNFILQSQNLSNSYWGKVGITVAANIVKQDTSNGFHRIYSPSRSVPQYNHTRSHTLLIKPISQRYIGLNADAGASVFGTALFDTQSLLTNITNSSGITFQTNSIEVKKVGDLIKISYVLSDSGSWDSTTNSVLSIQLYKEFDATYSSRTYIGDGVSSFEILAVDAKLENQVSTMIPTTTTPVTRPADYLLNNITGTTVTGDWDSTLNLSISNGQLVHSGYGRIRSLEIR